MITRKKIFTRSLMVMVALAAFSFASYGQDGRVSVQFAKGATSATVKRFISGNDGVITFILRAKKGQIMDFTVNGSSNLGIDFSKAGDQDFLFRTEPDQPNEYEVTKTGDHYITVINRGRTKANITLRVSIK